MERKDKIILWAIALPIVVVSFWLDLKYSAIAESGLTLASIVLAVYIAAIVGLINSDLAKEMAKKESRQCAGKSELGVLSTYLKYAIICAVTTVVLSSIVLLIPCHEYAVGMGEICLRLLFSFAICFYAENLVFLCLLVRFILNRQLWNK